MAKIYLDNGKEYVAKPDESINYRRDLAARILGGENLSEDLQDKVQEAYKLSSRYYHDFDHAADIGQAMSTEQYEALETLGLSVKQIYKAEQQQVLAGFYHDIVYAPVDNLPTGGVGVTADVRNKLNDIIDFDNKPNFKIREDAAITPATQIVLDMFKFNDKDGKTRFIPGDTLNPFGGQNEFLSALVMAKDLESRDVPLENVAQISQRIAATVPFDFNGKIEDLDTKLRDVNGRMNLGLDEKELRASFVGTIDLANRDVKGFGGEFKDYNKGTRNLLAENRPELRDANTSKPENLFTATVGAAGFTGGAIKPETIFHQAKFEDKGIVYPPNDELKAMTDKARDENIPSGVIYLEALAAAAAITRATAVANDMTAASLPSKQLADPMDSISITQTATPSAPGDRRLDDKNIRNAIEGLRSDEPGFQPDKGLRETAAKLLEAVGPDGVRKIAQTARDPEVKFPMPAAMKKFETSEAAKAFLDSVGVKIEKELTRVPTEIEDATLGRTTSRSMTA
jgi:hypothetical protein